MGNVKSTIVGTIIIGIFMMVCTMMVTSTVKHLAHSTRQYIDQQKREAKAIVKQEKAKAKDVFLEGAKAVSCGKK